MGILCFKPGFVEATLVNGIYPSNSNDDVVRSNLDKLTMHALSNADKLILICTIIEQNVKKHLAKRKYNFVIIGAKAMDGLVTSCHNDLTLFISNVTNIVKLLLDHPDCSPQLKIKAIETVCTERQQNMRSTNAPQLGTTVQYLGEHRNNFVPFVDKLIQCTTYSDERSDEQAQFRYAKFRIVVSLTCKV